MTAFGPRFRLRFSLIDGPELRCPKCWDWWPIDTESWIPNRWDECRQCLRERARLYYILKAKDPEFRSVEAARGKKYRQYLRRHAPTYLPIYDRERRARKAAELRVYRARMRDAA